MTVIGRSPPDHLIQLARRDLGGRFTFTGWVDDVQPHCRGANAYVIPLRVGGGMRLKAYDAMAMGCAVVLKSLGVEGLPIEDGVHFLRAYTAEEIVRCLGRVLTDHELATSLATAARDYVATDYSYRNAAAKFAEACELAISTRETAWWWPGGTGMCGIHGLVGLKPGADLGEDILHRMEDVTVHRGPDDFGHYTAEGVALGMRRLSIIDLEGGHQPISNKDDTLWLVCNGEIYNFRELRADLRRRGYEFKTHSDSEVVAPLRGVRRRKGYSPGSSAGRSTSQSP